MPKIDFFWQDNDWHWKIYCINFHFSWIFKKETASGWIQSNVVNWKIEFQRPDSVEMWPITWRKGQITPKLHKTVANNFMERSVAKFSSLIKPTSYVAWHQMFALIVFTLQRLSLFVIKTLNYLFYTVYNCFLIYNSSIMSA